MTTITADLVSGYRVDITNERHRWTADEPPEHGGGDAGPSPYEMLLGAAAACTAMTLSMYAQRKGIHVDSVSVQYSFDRVHNEDSAGCVEGGDGWLHRIQSQVFVEGRFDEEPLPGSPDPGAGGGVRRRGVRRMSGRPPLIGLSCGEPTLRPDG
jgi:putative redox protein